ncbi:MAG: phosphoribosyl-ATP pyrophosphohydrolase [Clostridiales bacterium]|nr:phosphoribosyl-ATP pyrophosphohydrolase [Clostridiales bacterium]
MKLFNKLVRDKIPEIIRAKGENCETRILGDEEYIKELETKLQEEMHEYLESGDIEELADLEEVLRAILDAKNCAYSEFESIRQKKVDKRGAFKNRIYLKSTD